MAGTRLPRISTSNVLPSFESATGTYAVPIGLPNVGLIVPLHTVPLGSQFNPNTLHGLANSTGGAVLRTQIEAEKLIDALKRYEDAFAASVLYSPSLQLPADITEVCPSVLPPLRSDTPTLVVGRMKKEMKDYAYELTGTIAGRKTQTTVKATEKVQAPSLDNYFLVSMIDQWTRAKAYPAVLRADRALSSVYEQTRLCSTPSISKTLSSRCRTINLRQPPPNSSELARCRRTMGKRKPASRLSIA